MYWQSNILAIIILGFSLTAKAQDSTIVPLVKEQTSAVVELRDDIYTSPSLRVYQRQNTYSQLATSFRKYTQNQYLQQEGSGNQTFTVYSETYQKYPNSLTIWGNAYYNSQQLYNVKFNETADYHLVYPYVMADSVGGNLKAETYAFSGGMAKEIGRYQLGFNIDYRGLQSYRDRDPRPKNISSEINLALSASRKISDKYALALDITGTKYNQTNKLTFVSELGQPLVYHDAGLGVYNQLLSGSLTSAWYNGTGYKIGLTISPVSYQGFFGGAILQNSTIRKKTSKLQGVEVYDAGEIQEQIVSANTGYLLEKDKHQFIIKATAQSVKRKGIEAIFDVRDSEVGIYKISSAPRYLHQYEIYNLRGVYGRTGGVIDWYAGLEGSWEDHQQKYALPDREMAYQHANVNADLTLRKQLGSTLLTLTGNIQRKENLSNNFFWGNIDSKTAIYSMLNSNFTYLTTSTTGYGGSIRIDFPVTKKLACYLKAAYDVKTSIEKQSFNILAAFQF
ncbi:hypothetical protein DVR12_07865 [Chitinophaga silvatica]|uniref:DUF6850 domain-containing protein n=1 Tax=Chitinophaga silvatica TaxID=2282649 RepID=A0A3E1YF03_9BACT|nr:DUF6850 family outer membrane beta-barrel protein [Chitinophaga silvatica]RFS25091.1 hypothetical protein DVR12_07865 [Chitinophaga silvatica]